MKQPFIYIRALRHAEHTVFCVQDGQKNYYNTQFRTQVPFSSGQQVKRSLLESMLSLLGKSVAPVTFNFEIDNKDKLGNGEPWSACDPTYPDQLIGGWMMIAKGGDSKPVKRRSPLSISAMRPLHPLLSSDLRNTGEGISFDRSNSPEQVTIRVSKDGNELSQEEIESFLNTKNVQRSLNRLYMPPDSKQTRASGLFIYDIAIDLRTLFSVSINQHEPELNPKIVEKLRESGWIESSNAFGKCLICPKAEREKIIPALAHGLINWRITSNQARTFSLMETLAIAVSDNANKLAGAIRAKLVEETEKPRATPIIDVTAGANLFIALPCDGYVVGIPGTANALEDAEKHLIQQLSAFDYEHQ